MIDRERAIDFMPPGQEQVAIIVDVSPLPIAPIPQADARPSTNPPLPNPTLP